MNAKNALFTVLIVVLISGLFVFASIGSQKDRLLRQGTAMSFPASADFAGEPAPLNILDVKERLDKELVVNANYHSATIFHLKRAHRYFPVIEPILKQYNVPDDFKYLAVIESGLANVVSGSGARGFWQFMDNTAKEKGLEVTETVDERYHLEKATVAACKYFLAAKEKFGSWTMVAASYNAGMNGIAQRLEEQKVGNYYDLALPDETSRYVFRILAVKEIMKNPAMYGFTLYPSELYNVIPTKKIAVDSTINNLADFALKQGVNYKILKLHNPWLRDKKLSNASKKTYEIEIPTEGY